VTSNRTQIVNIIKQRKSIRPAELVTLLGITPQALHRHLGALCRGGVLKKVGSPPLSRYELIREGTQLVPSQQKMLNETRSILGSHPAILLVTLFGSVARGDAGPDSDIDLLIWIGPTEEFCRRDIWDFWDRQSRGLKWAKKVSLIVQRLRPRIHVSTLLLDLPEEHIVVFDRKNYFSTLRNTIIQWRNKNGSIRINSFDGKHGWKYSTKASHLDEIDFGLELGDVP